MVLRGKQKYSLRKDTAKGVPVSKPKGKLRYKYRLVIMDDELLEEKASLQLSLLNVFSWGGAAAILLIGLTTVLIAFTPLRELIPGYAKTESRQQAILAVMRVDSLSNELRMKELYMQNLRAILRGENPDSLLSDSVALRTEGGVTPEKLHPTHLDSVLRQKVESEDIYNVSLKSVRSQYEKLEHLAFFPPVSGLVSASFNPGEKHYGTDLVGAKNEVVKATLDGTIIMANWTSDNGHVIHIQHRDNIISVYKHNSVLFRSVGEKVEAGEAIAVIGESGELSSGPHLHFELWHKGNPINPEDYIIFSTE